MTDSQVPEVSAEDPGKVSVWDMEADMASEIGRVDAAGGTVKDMGKAATQVALNLLAPVLEAKDAEITALKRQYVRLGSERDEKQFEVERLRRWVERFRVAVKAPEEGLSEEEAELVETAMRCVEADSSAHWPSVAGWLHVEVVRLRGLLAALPSRYTAVPPQDAERHVATVLEAYWADVRNGRREDAGDDAEAEQAVEVMRLVRSWFAPVSESVPAAPRITHGTRVLVYPGPRHGTPDIGRNHGVGRITWISNNIDPMKSRWGVAMEEPYHGTSEVGLYDFEVLPEEPDYGPLGNMRDAVMPDPLRASATSEASPLTDESFISSQDEGRPPASMPSASGFDNEWMCRDCGHPENPFDGDTSWQCPKHRPTEVVPSTEQEERQ